MPTYYHRLFQNYGVIAVLVLHFVVLTCKMHVTKCDVLTYICTKE